MGTERILYRRIGFNFMKTGFVPGKFFCDFEILKKECYD
jgi:hypothetical protein